jgi:hypothetical protein
MAGSFLRAKSSDEDDNGDDDGDPDNVVDGDDGSTSDDSVGDNGSNGSSGDDDGDVGVVPCHTLVLKSTEPKPPYVCPGCLITCIATI